MQTSKEKRMGICSLVHSTSGVEGHVKASGWGLGQVTSESIIHMDMYKPNNTLVNG